MKKLMTDEDKLIEASRKGDLEAFNRLVLAYQGMAYNNALRFLNDEDEAADVVQISFISAYRNIRSFRGGSFKAWLLRIVTNNCYDELRRQKRKPAQPLDAYDSQTDQEIEDPLWMADDSNLPEEKVAQRELEMVIRRCIEALPVEFRAVVLLVDINGLDYKQSAKAARIPIGTVRSRLARARQRLQTCLQDAWELLPEKYRLKDESRP
jgi:RNA polymerase sigma-70 factor, ECF subfamily